MLLNHRIIGEGPPIIILHGLFGSLDNWMTITRKLSEGNTVYLMDLRNHGKSFHHERFDYDAMTSDVEAIIEEYQIDHPSVIGHSLGGKVAMFLAGRNQQLLSKLIVVDIGPKYYPVHHQDILKGLFSLNPEEIGSRNQASDMLAKYIPKEGTRQFLLKNLKRRSSGGFEWGMNLSVIAENIQNVGEALPDNVLISSPTLFIRGDNSDYITTDDYEPIASIFSDHMIKTVPNVGHWVHAEAPQQFMELVSEFID